MKFKTNHTINTQFSMSSMTDIVFLLLIFLLLTLSVHTPTGLTIRLPTSTTNTVHQDQVNITITAERDYYVDEQPTTLSQLKEVLQTTFLTKEKAVLLHMDKSVPIEYMIQVADIATTLQATVAVATKLDR